jgi:hypothetical protein
VIPEVTRATCCFDRYAIEREEQTVKTLIGVLVAGVVALTSTAAVFAASADSLAPGRARAATGYASGFRAAYMPVVTTLHGVSGACPDANTVQKLPACAARVAPFRTALAHLLAYVTHTAPPAQAKADVRTLAASIRILQQRFATLAMLLRQKNLARVRAMGGLGHPIDNAINAFVSAVGSVVIDVPGLRVPLP